MAKWGKGDPRWLVEERPDATNVNNWHWSEKNASSWSKNEFSKLFIGLKIQTHLGYCEITEIIKCDGDAVVNNRKGKLIYFYEWHLEMKWIAVPMNGELPFFGKISVSNFTEEHDIIDTDINVHYDKNEYHSEYLGDIMEHQGKEAILEQLENYVTELKEDFSKDLILPTCYSSFPETAIVKKGFDQYQPSKQNFSDNMAECNTEFDDLHSTEHFKCTSEEFYRVLTVKELVQAFTQSDCILEPREGGKLELFDGNVQGHFVKLHPFHTIVIKWRFTSWPKNHFSTVVISINQKEDYTEVNFSQYGIPKQELENTREGWKRHYWDSIKRAFGYGAFLF